MGMEMELLERPWIWIAMAWLALGLLLGVGHSLSLRHSVARPGPSLALLGMARIAVVAAVLILASTRGGLKPTVLGWIIGFLLATLFYRPRATPGQGRGGATAADKRDTNREDDA